MYAKSELYPEIDGQDFPILHKELAEHEVELTGQQVVLRALIAEDANDYFAAIEYDRDHLSQFGDKTARNYPTPETVLASIVDPENPIKLRFGIWNGETMVGSINLTPDEGHKAEIGYWIGKEHIGHGYASDALATLTDFALDALGYQKLEAEAVRENTASRATLEKCGFTETGEFRGRDQANEHGATQTYTYVVYELDV